ncbi:MAG: YihY/virulence factor BrkB family protein [Actinomycetota bacterium]|nr:YihY/virulence factor BrkB family protein [Actinomycetota bacterium]
MFAALGYVDGVFGPETAIAVEEWVLEVAGSLFSQQALDEIVRPTVEEVLTAAAGGIVSVGFLITLWSGSSAMAAFVDAITRAHDQYEVRNLVWQRVLAMLIYLVGLVTGIIAIPLLTLGPDLLIALLPDEWEAVTGTVVEFLYYPAVGVVLLLALTTLYKVALPLKPPWHRGLPGALLAVLIFFSGTGVLRVYLDSVTAAGVTYGALAAPIAFLLATFAIGFGIVLGAHLNAAVQALWPAPLVDARRRLERSGPGTPELRRAIREHPNEAGALLERMGYEVRRRDDAGPND